MTAFLLESRLLERRKLAELWVEAAVYYERLRSGGGISLSNSARLPLVTIRIGSLAISPSIPPLRASGYRGKLSRDPFHSRSIVSEATKLLFLLMSSRLSGCSSDAVVLC